MPVITAATTMYKTVQSSREVMIPMGTSRWGFLASSAWVETESNPIYAKKMIADPASMPSGSPPAPVWPRRVLPNKLKPE